LLFGVLSLAAIAKQLSIHIQNNFNVVNFFSYFTNLSNIFAAVLLVVGAIYLIQNRKPSPTVDIIRGASAVSMAIVGIVFSVLLRNVDLGHLLPWVNVVLHYVMPIVVVADWFITPPQIKPKRGYIKYWLIFPLIYLVYSILRGASTGFYAYPFFNPAKSGGYAGVSAYCLAILIAFLVCSWLLIGLGNQLKRDGT
jgi:hypothetical protein